MLTCFSSGDGRDCSGTSRRDFLRIGALGTGALTLPNWLASRSFAATSGQNFVRDRAVVFLYLSGGGSHIETFNPNMDAPAPYCSVTGEVKTSVPGLTFGGTFPLLAKQAHRMAIVKSHKHRVGDHEKAHVHVLSGGTDPVGDAKRGFSIGSFTSRLGGATHAESGMPSYSLLTEQEADRQYKKELGRVRRGSWPGSLGAAYAPFERCGSKRAGPSVGGLADDMQLRLPLERIGDRRRLLESMDRLRERGEASESLVSAGKYQQQAFDLILGSATKAFDIDGEDPKLVERYSTDGMRIGHSTHRQSTLGKQMLVARRLVENGCRFITVHSAGWDMHADGNNPPMLQGMNMLGRTVDRAVSAFIDDLVDRGLFDKTLLVISGDFGRTPKINKSGGRDHWANLCTLAFAGGGLPGGAVVGRSDNKNAEPSTDPIGLDRMRGTILHTLFDFGELRVARGIPRELVRHLEDSPPIEELVSSA